MQKRVNLVDLVKSFPTNIYLQNLASIQKRTSFVKFAHLAEKSGKGSISTLSTKVWPRVVLQVIWEPLEPPQRFVLLGEAVVPPVESLRAAQRLSLPLQTRNRGKPPANCLPFEYWEEVVRPAYEDEKAREAAMRFADLGGLARRRAEWANRSVRAHESKIGDGAVRPRPWSGVEIVVQLRSEVNNSEK